MFAEKPMLALLAAGLAAVRGDARAPPLALRSLDVDEALAAAALLQVDALAALGAAHLGLALGEDGERRRRRARQRAAVYGAAAVEVARLLDAAGVKHAFFKGVVADAAYFGGRGL